MSAEAYRSQLVVPGDRVISAFDRMNWIQAYEQAAEIGPYIGLAKANSLVDRVGSDVAVLRFAGSGLLTMLDAKFHDTPDTVEDHLHEVTLSGPSLITVHASGGMAMLKAAVKGRDGALKEMTNGSGEVPMDRIGGILGITVLTSLDSDDCESIFGIPAADKDGIKKKVIQFAHMAHEAGLDGIVCSPLELEALRAISEFDDLLIVTPGITPSFATKAGDQKRTASPQDAMRMGADLVVVGRGISRAKDYDITKAQAAEATAKDVAIGLGLAA